MRIIGNDPNTPRQTQRVASGTLPNGKPVVVNADGTVSAVDIVAGDNIGSFTSFTSNSTAEMSSAFDSTNNKVVIVYKDNTNSQYGTAVVGTVSGSSISFGTPVVFETAVMGNVTSTAFDANAGKIVIAYKDEGNSFYGTAIVGTVSGTSISFGTAVVFSSVLTSNTNVVYDSTNNKMVFSYSVSGPNGKARVGTVSGTSISFGTEVTFNSGNSGPISSTFDSTNGKAVIVFRDGANSDYGTAIVGTVSGTSISFGSEAVFSAATTNQLAASFDANAGKVVIAYQDGNSSNQGKVVVGTVSGTSISYGTAANLNPSGEGEKFRATYDSSAQKVRILYIDKGDSNKAKLGSCTISGTSVSVSNFEVGSSLTGIGSAVYDSAQDKTVLSFTTSSQAVVFGTTSQNLTAENYIGISDGINEQTGSEGSTGSTNTFNSRTTSEIYGAYDENSNRVVIAYRDNGNGDNGTVIVGSISGTTITFGSPEIYHANLAQDNTIVFDSANNKVVISFIAWDNSNNRYGTSVVGTVSGTSISLGTPVQFNGIQTTEIASCFDSNSNKVVVVYRDISNSNYGTARVGTVSGTSISFGTEVVYESASTADNSIVFDSNSNKVVVAYYDGGNGTKGTAVVGTVSGTSISFGTPVVWDGGVSARHIATSFDTNSNKVVIAYVESSGNDIPKAIVGTVSGTSITFGSPTAYSTVAGDRQSMVYDASVNRHVIFFSDEGDSFKGKTVSGLVSGTSISFTEKALVADDSTQHLSAVYDPDNGKVILSFDNVSNNYGVSAVHTADTISTTTGEVADGGNAIINVKGNVSDNLIGLTPAQSYYVQTDGTITTTAGDPSVFAGTAISSTKLIVKG